MQTMTKRPNPDIARVAADLERTFGTMLPHLTPEWRANARDLAERVRPVLSAEQWARLDMLLQFHGA